MKKYFISAFLFMAFASLTAFGQSCDNGTPADPTDDTFQWSDISAILNANCAPCHIGGTSGGLDLTSYAGITAGGFNYGATVIIPGNSAASGIIDKLTNASPAFGGQMPASAPGSLVGTQELQDLMDWIDQGAPEFCPSVCPGATNIITPTDACASGITNVCVDFDMTVDNTIVVTVDGIVQDGSAGGTQICVNVPLPSNNSCNTIPYDFTVTATCNGTPIDLSGIIVLSTQVYGDALPPTIQVTPGDPQCTYTIVPACAGDTFVPDPLANENCGTSGLPNEAITVTTDNGCVGFYQVPKPDCPACGPPSCPNAIAAVAPGNGCSEDLVNVCVDFDATVDNTIVVTVDGVVQDGSAGGTQICVNLNLPQNISCNNLPHDFTITATCAGAPIDLSGIVLTSTQVFAAAQAPTLQVTPGDPQCTYTIVPACNGDTFVPNPVADENCGTSGLPDENIQVTTSNGCIGNFAVPKPDCPSCNPVCPTAYTGPAAEAEDLCADAASLLPTIATDILAGLDVVGDAVVVWDQDPAAVAAASPAGCVAALTTYTASIECPVGTPVAALANIFTHTVTVHPDLSTLGYAIIDPLCGPEVTLPGDCGANITISNDVDGNGGSPDYSAITNAGPINFTVTNADATGLGACESFVISENYDCTANACSITNVTVTADGACNGDDAEFTVCFDVTNGSGNYDLIDTGNGNAVITSMAGGANGNMCFNATITGPTTAGTINVDVQETGGTCQGGSPVVVNIPECPVALPCGVGDADSAVVMCEVDGTGANTGLYTITITYTGDAVAEGGVFNYGGAGVFNDDGAGTITITGLPTNEIVSVTYTGGPNNCNLTFNVPIPPNCPTGACTADPGLWCPNE